jgi:cobalt-zinc-cadmium efflux system protein
MADALPLARCDMVKSHDTPDRHARPHTRAHGHTHAQSRATQRALWVALLLTGGFAVVEAAAGVFAGSLALISDAGHMVTDAASFVVALIAAAVTARPPSERASYGYARAEVLAAFVNALAMLGLIVWIAVEAVTRLLTPVPVAGPTVMFVALAGLAVNLVVAFMLSKSSHGINARAALLHVMGDLLGSVAALVAGAVVYWTGWTPMDPILSLVVALLILRSTLALLKESTGVLLEGVPGHVSYDDVGRALAGLPGVTGVHDLHVWQMSAERVALSAHLTLTDGPSWPKVLVAAQRMLARDFGIDHVTLQPAWVGAPPAGRVIPVAVSGTVDPHGKPGRGLH